MRITSHGPSSLLGASAIPVPAGDARAYQSRGFISGSPGVRAILVARPSIPQDRTAQAGMHSHRSSNAPDFIRPSLYFLFGKQAMTPPVSVTSDNQMPVPAVSPFAQPFLAARRAVMLGQQQVVQPAVAAKYPNRKHRR